MNKECLRFVALVHILFVIVNVAIARPPEGYAQRLQAYVNIKNMEGVGLPNVLVSFQGEIEWIEYGEYQWTIKYASGYTDNNGFLYIYRDFILGEDYNYPVDHMWISVTVSGIPAQFVMLEQMNMYGFGDIIDPTMVVMLGSQDENGNRVPDAWEMPTASTFSPGLHKHSWDRQPGLANFEDAVYGHSNLKGADESGATVYNNRIPPIHVRSEWRWDSFGFGSVWIAWKINIDDEMRYWGSPVGSRPVYFHFYKPTPSDHYYYLQYWYFHTMNDISAQTAHGNWHEGDWEHVSIKLIRVSEGSFIPSAINFYVHEGGKTRTPSQTWWSSTNSATYTGMQQGYDASHTHLHVWLAANSHAS
jgi:hypothetical protein